VVLGLLSKIGFNRTIGYAVINKFVQAVANLLIIFFISQYMSKTEQGYYYTFNSMAALQIFFELGLSFVLLQFLAHEFAHMQFDESSKEIAGSFEHKTRIASILRLSFKWYSISALLLLVIIMPAGFYFFAKEANVTEVVNWHFPWFLVMFATAVNLVCSPFFTVLEGMGRVLEVAKLRFIESIISYIVLLLSLYFHLGLYSLAFFILSTGLCSIVYFLLARKNRAIFDQIKRWYDKRKQINWKKEIFPFQWKIAVSWLSSYFIFQLLNPVLFAYKGPIIAGQMGITLTIFGGLSAISMTWITTKVPAFSMLVAKKDYDTLDRIFFKTIKESLVIGAGVALSAWLILLLLNIYLPEYGSRFLMPVPALFIAINSIVSQVIYALAVYLRCHKEEPLLLPSIAGAVTTSSVAFICSRWFGVTELTLSLMLIGIIFYLPWSIKIFIKRRLQWHFE
jgi:O-antigen/teichoic acid export membrane protein